MRDPSELSTAEDVDALAAELFGAPLSPMNGVLHVMAVAREGETHRVIKIGPHAPRSALDFFSLNLARARVESILVTGGVLRAEPELRYELGAAPSALQAWRSAHGLEEPPFVVILSRGALPTTHPVWSSWARPIAFVPESEAARLRAALPSRVEVVGAAQTDARAALDYLLGERGCRSVSVEAGPSVAVPLYESPARIDELMLSVYAGALDPRARGGELLGPAQLAARMVEAASSDIGAWSFSRWLLRPGSPAGSR